MFASLVTVVLAATGVAFAGPLKRFDGISVTLAGPATNVSSLSDLKFTASVTNTGTEDIKVLKYGTALDSELPTKSFIVTKDGQSVPFTGVRISVSLEDTPDSAFAFIPAGETVTVEHDVSSLYDFEAAGAGVYAFSPNTNFQVAQPSALVKSTSAMDLVSSTGNTVEVFVSGDLSKREMKHDKRARNTCSNSSQASFITSAYNEGKTLATRAASYISSNGANSLYTSYYGTNSQSTVRGVFTAVAGENSSSRTLSCVDTYGVCTGGVIAYTVISTTNIYFCSIFFNEVPIANLCTGTTVASRSARGGTVLHELTHALSGTDDVTYGCSADQSLSNSNKLINADNYNCFSTQVYQNTGC